MCPKLERSISWFDKDGDDLIGEFFLYDVKLDDLQRIFRVPAEDPMFDVFKLKEAEAEELKKIDIKLEFDFENYEYFLECFELT